jgi:hypothetical protein
VDDVRDLPNDTVKPDIDRVGGYRVLGYHLEFMGTCPQCDTDRRPTPSGKSQDNAARSGTRR